MPPVHMVTLYGYSVQWLCFRLGFVWDWSGKHLPSECVLLLLCRWSDVFFIDCLRGNVLDCEVLFTKQSRWLRCRSLGADE